MNNQNLIVYQFNAFYQIVKEIEDELKLSVIEVNDKKLLSENISKLENYIIVSNNKELNHKNQIVFHKLPLSIFKITEKLNLEFLKKKFVEQSEVLVKNYLLDLNSREINFKKKKLKLTEKEVKIIMYLFRALDAVPIEELQNNVWSYQSDLETHTVETHIYRLRKKFSNVFNDNDFVKSHKNGYKI